MLSKSAYKMFFSTGMILHLIAGILTYYFVDVTHKFIEGNPLSLYLGSGIFFISLTFIVAILCYILLYIIIFKWGYNDNFSYIILIFITLWMGFDAFHDIILNFPYLIN